MNGTHGGPDRLGTHGVICEAIRAKRLLIFGYWDSVRVVEPHLYGVSTAGHEVVSAWLRPGQSRADPKGGWRRFRVDWMRNIEAVPDHFPGPRPGYHPEGERVTEVFCRLDALPEAPPAAESSAGAPDAAPDGSDEPSKESDEWAGRPQDGLA